MRDTLASCAAWLSHRSGFPCCRAQALAVWASVAVAHRLIRPVACRIFPDQRWNHVPCTGASRFLTSELPAKSSFYRSHFMPHPTFLDITPPWTSLWPVPAPSFMSCLPGFLSWACHTLASYPIYRRGDYWLWEGSSPQANPPQILLFSEFLQHWEPPSHNPDHFPCNLFSLKMFQFNRKLNRNHIFYLFRGPQSTWMNCTQFNWMHKIWLYVSILIVKYVNMCVCSFIRSFTKLILDTTFAFSPQNYHENFLLCID